MRNTYKEFNLQMGKEIKDLRIELYYTRETLAELSGISSKFLYELETGKKGCFVRYAL